LYRGTLRLSLYLAQQKEIQEVKSPREKKKKILGSKETEIVQHEHEHKKKS